MKQYPGSHIFLQEVVALLMSDHTAEQQAQTTEQTEHDPCGEAATLALAVRVAGVIRLQAGADAAGWPAPCAQHSACRNQYALL